MFFENPIRDDRSILDFLDADYTFVNEYLGQYYGLRDGKGPEFRKVSLANTPRRGILGQASMETISSYGNRTSVVLRGKWVLENLLNAPPPPPPGVVPDLEDAKVGADATIRQRMEAHRDNAVCASCHSKMDPLGFGLENFDAVGSWRDKEGKAPIDASGVLPDGRKFSGPVELTRLLRSESTSYRRTRWLARGRRGGRLRRNPAYHRLLRHQRSDRLAQRHALRGHSAALPDDRRFVAAVRLRALFGGFQQRSAIVLSLQPIEFHAAIQDLAWLRQHAAYSHLWAGIREL
jgi:hypothetical protein